MAEAFAGIIGRAKDVAHKRRQALSTAHLLVSAFQEDAAVRELLGRAGVSEVQLLSALGHVHDERHNAVDLCLDRAKEATGSSGRHGLSLVQTLLRDPRSAGFQCLVRAGAVLPLPHEPASASGRRALAAPPPKRRTRRDGGLRSAVLARETERKLLRRSVWGGAPGADSQPPRAAVAAAAATPKPKARPSPAAPSPAYALDPKRFPLLSSIGSNLSERAAAGGIDRVVGRDSEIDLVLDVLARRRGNNPVLVGAPGVGKTAIVEGLALALVTARAGTAGLRDRVVVEVSASSLLAGTGVRGALSERVTALCKEVSESQGRVLLFVDEIHGLLAGGDGEGSLGNELKTALARGALPVIGATTEVEYRRVFERDAALCRRFTRVPVGEPSRDDALRILEGVVGHYAAHHAVRYQPSALAAAVELSVRYLTERHLPDKAIALVDQAGARARRRGLAAVGEAEVASVVSELARVPVDRLLMRDADALLGLEQHLAARVVGQREATCAIAAALRKSAAGFRGARPLGTFLFLGPTGVGKTETAKAIAELLFPGSAMTRIDMSELGEPHAVARLFGAPPGYVGHDDGGQLTEAVRHRPYQLVLLDEIDKAHEDVLLALLPLLDEGRLTDGRGRTVDFTNTVIVMTSNLGAQASLARARIGFGGNAAPPGASDRDAALSAARASLAPELWNRIDEPLWFAPLSRHAVAKIAATLLAAVGEVVRGKHGVGWRVDPSAIDALIEAGGFDRALGARPMRRTISRLVEAPLAELLLKGMVRKGASLTLFGDGARLELRPDAAEIPAAE